MSEYPSRVQAYNCFSSRNVTRVASLGQLLLLAACAHHPPTADAAFREIQVHEATLARTEAKLADAPCSEARARVDELCSAKQALCSVSAKLRDPDATTRCLRAGDRCTAAREHIRARCATDALR